MTFNDVISTAAHNVDTTLLQRYLNVKNVIWTLYRRKVLEVDRLYGEELENVHKVNKTMLRGARQFKSPNKQTVQPHNLET